MKNFKHIRREGKDLLVVFKQSGVQVVGDDSSYYGEYFNLRGFDQFLSKNGGLANIRLAKPVRVAIRFDIK